MKPREYFLLASAFSWASEQGEFSTRPIKKMNKNRRHKRASGQRRKGKRRR